MKTPKEVFDSKYEFYRNMENKPSIPLEARELIFNVMEEYASEICQEQEKEKRQLLTDFIEWYNSISSWYISIERIDQFIQEHENK